MTRLRGTLMAAAAAVPLFLIGACAQAGPAGNAAGAASASDGRTPESGTPADALVLRTESFGGFVPPDRTVGRIPQVSVYGDGRVITEGPVPAIYPGPALPNLQESMITPEYVRQLTREGVAAGVKEGTDFGRPNVADAPSTRVTVLTADGPVSVSVEALREGRPDDPQLTAEQRTARTKLAAFVKKLQDLGAKPNAAAYEAEQVAVLARPWASPGGDLPKPSSQSWPGPQLPGPMLNENIGIGCVIVSGAEKDKVWTAAKKANQQTAWSDGYQKWAITFRPMLPDETDGCAVLKAQR